MQDTTSPTTSDSPTTRRSLLSGLGSGLVIGLAGCLGTLQEQVGGQSTPEPIEPGSPTDYPQFQADAAHTGVLEDRRGPADGATLQWTQSLSEDDQVLSQPVVAGNRLAVREDGTAYCLDLATGAVQWETDAGRWDTDALAPPVFDDGNLFVPTAHGLKACAPEDGSVRWEYGGGEPAGAFAVFEGTVLLAQSRGELVALGAADKKLRARVEPTFSDDATLTLGVAVSRDGTIVYPSPYSSELLIFEYGRIEADRQQCSLQDVAATTPTVRDGDAYVGFGTTADTDVGAVDLGANSLRHRTDFTPVDAFSVPPAVTDEYVIGGVGDTLLAVDRPSTGSPRVQWTTSVSAGDLGPPTVADDVVYVGTAGVPGDQPNFWALDIDSGEKRWAIRLSGGVSAPPVVTENAIYVSTTDGRIHALAP